MAPMRYKVPSSPLENEVFKLIFQQPAQTVGIFPWFHCSRVNISVWFALLTNHQPTRQNRGNVSTISLQLWECFCILQVASFAYTTTTTRQNCGNVSAISLQLWECFCKLRCLLTQPPQPGKIVGMFPRFRCSHGNVSASCVICLHNHHNQAKLWEYFCASHCSHRLSSKSWYYCISLISLRLLAVSGSCELWLCLCCVGTVNVMNCNKFLPTTIHHTAVNTTAHWLACGNMMR